MTTFDYITLLFYLIGLFAISTAAAGRTSNQNDMFAAGGQSPWWASGLSGFMTMFSAGTFVVWGGIAYESGLVAVAINTCYGIAAILVGYFVAGYWNRLGISTPAEFVQLRFGTTGLHFFTWTMLLKRILGVSVSLYALAVLLVALVPLNLNLAIVLFGGIVVLYTMQGGLWAVLMTDVLQFIVLTVVVMMVALLMIFEFDSPQEYLNAVPADFFSLTGGNYGWMFLCGWITIHFFLIGAEWAFVQRFLAVSSPKEARYSAYLFGVMYLITPVFWLLPPLLYRAHIDDINKEQAYILAAQSVLPPGMLGLMIAAMFSATASMVSSQLNVFAGVLTNDFFKPLFANHASGRTLVNVGRVFTALLGALLVVTAIMVPKMGGAEKLIISINSLLVVPLFAPTLWGLFSRSIGIREMMIVALTSFGIAMTLRFGIATNPYISDSGALWPLAQFLQSNAKNVEVVVGVLLPVAMLFAFQWSNSKVDPGAVRIEQHCRNKLDHRDAAERTKGFDAFPLRMVMISLTVIGLWFAILALQGERSVMLVAFACALLLGAFAIHRAIESIKNSTLNPHGQDANE